MTRFQLLSLRAGDKIRYKNHEVSLWSILSNDAGIWVDVKLPDGTVESVYDLTQIRPVVESDSWDRWPGMPWNAKGNSEGI